MVGDVCACVCVYLCACVCRCARCMHAHVDSCMLVCIHMDMHLCMLAFSWLLGCNAEQAFELDK